jgi:hypothetical protein
VDYTNSTAAARWWDDGSDNQADNNFFNEVRHVRVEVGPGNPGAVGLVWNVAQQTTIRDVSIDAGSGAIGLGRHCHRLTEK